MRFIIIYLGFLILPGNHAANSAGLDRARASHLASLTLKCLNQECGIARALPATHPARKVLEDSAQKHATDALAHVASGDNSGEHWLASLVFISCRLIESRPSCMR
jgi:hypothetical protein